jgi:hypothetical protein
MKSESVGLLNGAINEGYRKNIPVVVFSSEGKLLHGVAELQKCVDTKQSFEAVVIRGIDQSEWNGSDWTEIMDAARQVFFTKEA